jgi:hypothetical protein
MEFLRATINGLFSGVAAFALFAFPIFLLAWYLHRRRRKFGAEVLDPFTELPLRPPGESLRLKIDELKDEFDTALTVMCLCGVATATAVAAASPAERPKLGILLFLGLLGAYVVCARILIRTQRKLWDYRLGFTGERVVGEELNQLLGSGFRVFHDVPFEDFNIDHVLVGPPGVYAVETKSPRKRAAIKGLERATVQSTGTVLQFPTFNNTSFIEQARRNAKTLSEWLGKATGQPVHVGPILTLPGWRVERLGSSDVNVLRPDEIKRSFPVRAKQPLAAAEIQAIAYQLEERCRLPDPKV